MSRADRLPRLLHLLRIRTPPVTAQLLAQELGTSLRTVYRDIDTLRRSGALIDGEAGYGYTLTEDPALPPLKFDRLEIEALVLGLSQVRLRADAALVEATRSAEAKLIASLPETAQRQAAHVALRAVRACESPTISIDATALREACWAETAVDLDYADAEGRTTQRRVLPLTIVFWENVLTLLAWCELRQDYRQFRLDRIRTLQSTRQSFRPHRAALLRGFFDQPREVKRARQIGFREAIPPAEGQ